MNNCKRCLKTDTTLPSKYIGQTGQTGRTLREHFGEHKRGIQNNIGESVPIHFNLPHHTLNYVELILLLQVRNSRDSYRYTMEQHFKFISTAVRLKKWYKSDQWSLIIILPLCIVQPLHCVYVPIARVYPSDLLVNHIRGTLFKLLYINISNDSPYFRCPDEQRFYPFEILTFRTLKL